MAQRGGVLESAVSEVPYRPHDPKRYSPAIGLIGCGGITETHLKAYRHAGYRVTAMCDVVLDKAEERRQFFYPDAWTTDDHHSLLARDEIEVVDIATHPADRVPIIRAALEAGKHVLSQKPLALDLDTAEELVKLAEKVGKRLAVNQNGRWAPHFSFIREAIARGLIGEVSGVHMGVQWNHDWVAGTGFDEIRHAILYDFAIHWFDALATFTRPMDAKRVFATMARAKEQTGKPPLLGQVLIEYENAQASLSFDGFTRFGGGDYTYVAGTKGAIRSIGVDANTQTVTLSTAEGDTSPKLDGSWFPGGFHGTMGELLCAIEEGREPTNSARDNLRSLALCFAAVKSADTGQPQVPGTVRSMD